jgi:hypothetical protein
MTCTLKQKVVLNELTTTSFQHMTVNVIYHHMTFICMGFWWPNHLKWVVQQSKMGGLATLPQPLRGGWATPSNQI